jgi:hypothetical protein
MGVHQSRSGPDAELLVDFTKSRVYRTTDNALVEGKNGAVVPKHNGYGPIRCAHATAWQKSYTAYKKLISLKKWAQYLKPCIPADLLARQSTQRSDTEAALELQKAKLELLAKCRNVPR